MKPSDREFISESEDILEEAESHLLDVQDARSEEPDPDSINALFRCMHTLKGMSGLYGFQGLSDICHALESLLDDVRLGRTAMNEQVLTFLFTYLDVLKGFISDVKAGTDAKARDASEELAHIDEFRSSVRERGKEKEVEIPIDGALLKGLSEYEEHRLRTNIKNGKGIYLIRVVYSLMDFDSCLKQFTSEIRNAGELISTMPTSEGVPEGSIGFYLMAASGESLAEMKEILDADIEGLVSPKSSSRSLPDKQQDDILTKGVPSAGSKASGAGYPTVRVDIRKLDTSLNTIGELSVATSTLRAVWKELSETQGHTPAVIELYRVLQRYERRISELKDQILQIRMVPVSQIYSKLGQIVRRTARSLGKDIRMDVFGEDTEIDKSLAEEVLDPLIHIVRNAIDHGIEAPDDRVKLGKPSYGRIRMKSIQRGNSVVIEASDDGRGLDPEKLRARAISRGIIQAEEVLTDEDIFGILFMPGFSTKDDVSEVSGRGVGLDVVKEKISSLGGLVEIKSEKGTGTTFLLTLPITLAIMRALIVRVGETKFAVPLSSMTETFVLEEYQLQEVKKSRVLDLRGEVLPIRDLREVFGLSGPLPDRPFAVVAGMGEKRAVLMADELQGHQEIVIKTIGDYFQGVSGIAGAAEISRQEIILVLDVESIVSEIHQQHKGIPNV